MIGRIIEVVESDRRLTVNYGSMIISNDWLELGRVPLDDVLALIVNPHGATISAGLLAALAQRGAPVVIAGPNYQPVASLVPLVGHHAQGERLEAQVSATLPARKQAWKQVVRSKILMQSVVLDVAGADGQRLRELIPEVKSGDPTNVEAQAARLYWRKLFGKDFRREREAPGINSLLNYGYAVIRAATSRAIVAAGLHPSIGIFHSHPLDTMRLSDDLMEPYRALVDARVLGISRSGEELAVSPRNKRLLVALLSEDMPTASGTSPVSVAIHRTSRSLAQYFLGANKTLELPGPETRTTVESLLEADV